MRGTARCTAQRNSTRLRSESIYGFLQYLFYNHLNPFHQDQPRNVSDPQVCRRRVCSKPEMSQHGQQNPTSERPFGSYCILPNGVISYNMRLTRCIISYNIGEEPAVRQPASGAKPSQPQSWPWILWLHT